MSSKNQKEVFLDHEADSWYHRNKGVAYNAEHDMVMKVLGEYTVKPSHVLEIGCSTGYRLNAIADNFNAQVTGIEPSQDAIHEGKRLYPGVNFLKTTADDMAALPDASFDLVIIGFVLYVVDRHILLKAISEIDRVLNDGGVLMIIDFFSEKPVRNHYHHITEMEAYSFKQNYEDIFIASRLYHLLDKRSMSHSSKGYDLTDDYYNKYVLTTLRKDLSASYK